MSDDISREPHGDDDRTKPGYATKGPAEVWADAATTVDETALSERHPGDRLPAERLPAERVPADGMLGDAGSSNAVSSAALSSAEEALLARAGGQRVQGVDRMRDIAPLRIEPLVADRSGALAPSRVERIELPGALAGDESMMAQRMEQDPEGDDSSDIAGASASATRGAPRSDAITDTIPGAAGSTQVEDAAAADAAPVEPSEAELVEADLAEAADQPIETSRAAIDSESSDAPPAAESLAARAGPDADDAEAAPLSATGEIARVAFALLLTQRDGAPVSRLAEACGTSSANVKLALDELDAILAHNGLPLEVSRTGDKVQILTKPEVFPYVQKLKGVKRNVQLSPAALETLAVIAYRQPVIRAEVESIRGVKAGPMLRSLLEHKLVKVVGRADVPGRPLQYGTTQVFLERFGLESLKELPSIQEFKSLG